jgi:hypothetical protein
MSHRYRLRLAACLVVCHLLCLESLAGIASGLNALDSHCRPGACFCSRMMRAHRSRALPGDAPGAEGSRLARGSACGAPTSHAAPVPSLKIMVPVPPFDAAPFLLGTTRLARAGDRVWNGYREIETPPPR